MTIFGIYQSFNRLLFFKIKKKHYNILSSGVYHQKLLGSLMRLELMKFQNMAHYLSFKCSFRSSRNVVRFYLVSGPLLLFECFINIYFCSYFSASIENCHMFSIFSGNCWQSSSLHIYSVFYSYIILPFPIWLCHFFSRTIYATSFISRA